MLESKTILKTVASGALIWCLATAAGAAVVNLDTIGTFGATQSRDGNAVAGDGTSSINWGVSSIDSFNSGYMFDGRSVSTDAAGPFTLGVLTHRNGRIWRNRSTLESAELDLNISGQVAGQSIDFSRKLSFAHNETLNSASPCAISGATPCGDGVFFGLFEEFAMDFSDGDLEYRLTIGGFFEDALGTGDETSAFFTDEMSYSNAFIVGNLEVLGTETEDSGPEEENPISPVPLPAAGWMLLAGLGAVTATRRRRK